MSPVANLLICACAVLAMAASTAGLECYACTTLTDDKCGDPFTSETKVSDVLGNACTSCMKIAEGTSNVVRSCVPGDLPDGAVKDQCENIEAEGKTAEVCVCSTDLCNGIERLSGSVIVVLVVAMFKYLW